MVGAELFVVFARRSRQFALAELAGIVSVVIGIACDQKRNFVGASCEDEVALCAGLPAGGDDFGPARVSNTHRARGAFDLDRAVVDPRTGTRVGPSDEVRVEAHGPGSLGGKVRDDNTVNGAGEVLSVVAYAF